MLSAETLSAREVRCCPRCGQVFPPVQPGEAPVAFCHKDHCAIVGLRDFESSGRDPTLGTTVGGRFVVTSRLGSGSMGAVYKAWQTTVGRWVALKLMRCDRTDGADGRVRFEREARAMSQLVSPHTVTIYDFGATDDGSVFLAMELLEGETLGARLQRVARMNPKQAVRVACDALTSLAEAHAKGIIHRDLKPDNLFLSRMPGVVGRPAQEICKMLDFGIAKVTHEDQSVGVLETQAGTVFGTPRYMSPEQAQGRALDPRSDLYSVGVLLYQMVTGAPPFDDEDAVVVMARHIKTKPVPPRERAPDAMIPPQLERVILRALAKEPGDRPASADAFMQSLEAAERTFPDAFPEVPAALAGGTIAGMTADPLPTLAPSVVRRRRWGVAVAAGACLGVLVGVLSYWWGARTTRRDEPQASVSPSSAVPVLAPTAAATFTPPVSTSASIAASAEAPLVVGPEELPAVGTSRHRTSTKNPVSAVPASPPVPANVPPPGTSQKYERFE